MKRIIVGVLAALCVPLASAECSNADVSVKITRVRWVDSCTQNPCPILKGAAIVTHRCAEPIGVQLRIVGYDSGGSPIAVSEKWPWSVSNRPAGEHPISLDVWLEHDPEIARFGIDVVQVRQWPH